MKYPRVIGAGLALAFAACGAGETYPVRGTAQKGPFSLGSTVTIQELDDALRPNGRIYVSETTDVLGAFEGPTAVSSRYVEILITGNFFEETYGVSVGPITLRTVADLSASSCETNINVLTHLQSARLVELVRGGASFADAELQSASEVLAALHLPALPGTSFRCMDLTAARDMDAMLLTSSLHLLQAAYQWRCCDSSPEYVIPAMVDYVNETRLDLVDGVLEPGDRVDKLPQTAQTLSYECPDTVDYPNAALLEFYAEHGVVYTPLPWRSFLDADWDGTVNRDDATPGLPACP